MQKHEFILKVKQMKIKVILVTTLLSFNHHAFAEIWTSPDLVDS